jgi:uncharacterized membrane protein YfcA
VTIRELVLLSLAVLGGAGAQRLFGMGFALVTAPFLVLLRGPVQGVLLANVLSLVVNAVVLGITWRAVELRRGVVLAASALPLLPIGAWVAGWLPAPLLMVVIGSLIMISLLATMVSKRGIVLPGTGATVAAGAMSGFMNVTAGVGGPALSIYALSTRWNHQSFVATAQLLGVIVNTASVAIRGLPRLTSAQATVALCALAGGVVVGQRLTARINADVARRFLVGLALTGAAATMLKGLLSC